MRRRAPILLLALLPACAHDAPRGATASEPAARLLRSVASAPDTAVYVARQQGRPAPAALSSVMQLRVMARDAVVAVEDGRAGLASAGEPGAAVLESIAGSRAVSASADAGSDAAGAPGAAGGWTATVTTPVLAGERYLVSIAPATPAADSASLELSADGRRIAQARMPARESSGAPLLVEVAIGAGSLWLGPSIGRVELVPTCGTTHRLRSSGRADLFAQFEVLDTHEQGDLRIPPRDDDAQFRAVSFTTTTRGAVRITYLGHELARVEPPAGCPAV